MDPAVYRRIGANLHVILNDHSAQLRDREESAARMRETESLLTDTSARMEHNACANEGMAHAHMRAYPRVFADDDTA